MSSAPKVFRGWLAWLLLVPWLLLGVASAGVINEPDTFWHVRNGLYLTHQPWLGAGHVIRADSWTWTMAGHQWKPTSWVFDLMLAWLYRLAGIVGVSLSSILGALGVGVLVGYLTRRNHASAASVWIASALGCVGLAGWFSQRPQLASFVAVLTLVAVLVQNQTAVGSRRQLHLCVHVFILTAVWVNFHAFATISPALVGATVVELQFWKLRHLHLWARIRASFRLAWAPASAAGVGCCVSPLGPGVYAVGLHTAAASRGLIIEWIPLHLWSLAGGIVVVLSGGLCLAVWRAWRQRVTIAMPASVAGAFIGGCLLFGTRFYPFAVITSLIVVAGLWPARLPACERVTTQLAASGAPRGRARGYAVVITGGLLLGAMGPVAGSALTHLGRNSDNYAPPALMHALPPGCRLLATAIAGSSVELARPDVTVAVDGRNDFLGRELTLQAQQILDGTGSSDPLFAALTSEATCALVPAHSTLVDYLLAQHWTLPARTPTTALLLAPHGH